MTLPAARVLLLSFALATVGLAGCVPATLPDRPVVKLAVSPTAPQFTVGDPVTLSIDLENVGIVTTRVSTLTDGNLRIVALDRDGSPVVPRETTIRYRDSLKSLLNGTMATLAPGEHVVFDWQSVVDPPQSGPAFQVVRYDPDGADTASLSAVAQPGRYTMTLVYRFGDPWGQPYDVFTGETNQATVTFVVGP